MRCYVLQPFLGRLVRISLHQLRANFSPFNIVHKIDDRKAYVCLLFDIYIVRHGHIHGLEINI